jgi:hypothetical protein
MSLQPLSAPPVDRSAAAEARNRLQGTETRVRAHLAERTLAQPDADLHIAQLAREVRGMSRYLRLCLVTFHGTGAGLRIYQALFAPPTPSDPAGRKCSVLEDPVMSAYATRVLTLHGLCETAQHELDVLIRRTAAIETITRRARLTRDLLDAEERGDTRHAAELAAEFARESAHDPQTWKTKLARARRDRIRLAQLDAAASGPVARGRCRRPLDWLRQIGRRHRPR